MTWQRKLQINKKLENCHAKANELNETKKSFIVLFNSVNHEIDNFYSRLTTYNEWAKKLDSNDAKIIAEKNCLSIKQNIAKLKIGGTLGERSNFTRANVAQVVGDGELTAKQDELDMTKSKLKL